MAGKNYRRGAWVESQAVMILTANGFWAERSHASKGLFDIRALSSECTLLISCRRSKSRIVTDRAVINSNRDTVLKLIVLPDPPNVSKELWHYQDPQNGDRSGTWRRYRISGTTVTPLPMLPIPRGKDRKIAEARVIANREQLKSCESASISIRETASGFEVNCLTPEDETS